MSLRLIQLSRGIAAQLSPRRSARGLCGKVWQLSGWLAKIKIWLFQLWESFEKMKNFKQIQCCLPIFLGRGEGVNLSHNAAFDPTASKSSSFSVMPPNQALLPWDLPVAIDGSLTFAFFSLPHQRLPAATPASSALLAQGEAEGAKTPGKGASGSPAGKREGGQSQKHRLASTTRAAFRAGWQLGSGGAGERSHSCWQQDPKFALKWIRPLNYCCVSPAHAVPLGECILDEMQVVESAVNGWGVSC